MLQLLIEIPWDTQNIFRPAMRTAFGNQTNGNQCAQNWFPLEPVPQCQLWHYWLFFFSAWSECDIMAVCTVRPHNIETQLNHYGNWLRTVTGSMSKIYNVIEIYIIIVILCFLIFPPLLSTTFPKPLLIHLQHLKKKNIPPDPVSVQRSVFLLICRCWSSQHIWLTVHNVHIWTKRMWQIWANIDESDPLT